MKGGGSFLVIVVGIVLLSAILYGKTGCFGGFWNCVFGNSGSAPNKPAVPSNLTNGIVGQTQTFSLSQFSRSGALAL